MLADTIKIIDVDCHISEPYDVWTSRVSKKWGDLVPHVRDHPETGVATWILNGEAAAPVGMMAMAGWRDWMPSHPPTLEEADPASWDSEHRLRRMDEYGIYAEILYPNVGGFGNASFLKLGEPELMLDCIRAYNDFQTEWCAADPKRLIPITALPFWDLDACRAEIERCAKLGHKGILMNGAPEKDGQVHLGHPDWAPIFHTAEDLGLAINFHVGSGGIDELFGMYEGNGRQANIAQGSVKLFMANVRQVCDVIVSGICHRHPKLKIVSVEAGIGWLPFVLEALDWQWFNNGANVEHPEYDLIPSEYFKRQIYAPFWFEKGSALDAIRRIGADNFLYETDFPHPTSMSPGPASMAQVPKDYVEEVFSQLPEEDARKVLRDNAIKVYNLDE